MVAVITLGLAFLVPLLAVIGLLTMSARLQRAREAVVARQVAVTEAIHRELGAIVAPIVRKPAWRPWQVQIAVDFDHPFVVTNVLAVASDAFARIDRFAPVRFVLVPRRTRARVA